MVTVPCRELAPGLGATWNATVPLPLPVRSELKLIQSASRPAAHPHDDGAVTLTLPAPPSSGKLWTLGEIEKLQAVPPALPLPVPVRSTVCVTAGEPNVTTSEAFRVPAAAGLKLTRATQLIGTVAPVQALS